MSKKRELNITQVWVALTRARVNKTTTMAYLLGPH